MLQRIFAACVLLAGSSVCDLSDAQIAAVTKLKLRGLFLLTAYVVVEKTDASDVNLDMRPAPCDLHFLHTLFARIIQFSFF
jgi:hypothetical protein